MKQNINYLPIGSVVLLKNGTKKVMIIGYCVIESNNPNVMYDYCGCLYPEGIVSSKQNLLFNQEQIEKVFYLGYKNDEQISFSNKLASAISKFENS